MADGSGGSELAAGSGAGETLGVGAGPDDGAVEGEAVDDDSAEAGSVNVLVQPPKDSLERLRTIDWPMKVPERRDLTARDWPLPQLLTGLVPAGQPLAHDVLDTLAHTSAMDRAQTIAHLRTTLVTYQILASTTGSPPASNATSPARQKETRPAHPLHG